MEPSKLKTLGAGGKPPEAWCFGLLAVLPAAGWALYCGKCLVAAVVGSRLEMPWTGVTFPEDINNDPFIRTFYKLRLLDGHLTL